MISKATVRRQKSGESVAAAGRMYKQKIAESMGRIYGEQVVSAVELLVDAMVERLAASIAEMVRQLRGTAGDTQIKGASVLQWGTCWGDSFILRN